MLGWLRRGRRRVDPRLPALRAAADAARDARRYSVAAELYERMLAIDPADVDVRIQCGHLRKEAGDHDAALAHYLAAWEMRPDDAELALQLGHFHKIVNRLDEAEGWYGRALALTPGWPVAEQELAEIARWRDEEQLAEAQDGLVPALAPGVLPPPLPGPDRIELRRFGRHEQGRWGARITLRGVEAIRGFCVSSAPSVAFSITLDGRSLHQSTLQPVEAHPTHPDRRGKHVFNVWLDFSSVAPGPHIIELRGIDADGAVSLMRERVIVDRPLPAYARHEADAFVTLDPADPRSPEEQIRALPSMIRPASRGLFPEGIRSVLVMRTDQLGDMVASVPAMRRLREVLPDARIVGLLTAANADLAGALGLFDEMAVIDFPDDWIERRRVMPPAEQDALRARLADHRFDLAIDLAVSDVSRPLLRLSGAKFLYGFGGGDWPWLDGRFDLAWREPVGGTETAPHAGRVLALIEALGATLGSAMPVISRAGPAPDLLPVGLKPGGRYAILHAGARIGFSRWPGFAALAEGLLAATDLTIVLMTDDPALRDGLSDSVSRSERLILIDHALPFDQLDALLSGAALVVGNDSGPKHLAALRGTKVVTLFSARIGWAEWGQENIGTVISRRVPCAGCAIRHDADECGKGFACIRDIGVEEVLRAALDQLG